MLRLSQQFHITFLAGGQCNEVKTTCPGLTAAASVVASLSWGRAVLSHSSREQDSGPRSYIQAADYTVAQSPGQFCDCVVIQVFCVPVRLVHSRIVEKQLERFSGESRQNVSWKPCNCIWCWFLLFWSVLCAVMNFCCFQKTSAPWGSQSL